MFIHQNCLRYLMPVSAYHDDNIYQRELEGIFRSSWQFICTRSELPRDGDFITLELCGKPILVRNFDGEIRAFLNVCSHRHCMLTCEAKGNSPTLRCQYHGWEYRADGFTGKIPEARAFRPMDREHSHLKTFPLEACGDLLFIYLGGPTPSVSLEDWLSPLYPTLVQAFQTPHWKMGEVWEFDCDCNWKIPVENTLESYHVAAVHPKWLGDKLPAEQLSEHRLDARYSTLRYSAGTQIDKRQSRIAKYLGGEVDQSYRHMTVHPNATFVLTDTFNYLATCQPTSATTCRLRTRLFALEGTRRNLFASLLKHVVWRIGRKTMFGIFHEDRVIFDAQQRGILASPHSGVIGTREERIYMFHRYVCNKLRISIPEDPIDFAGSMERSDSTS